MAASSWREPTREIETKEPPRDARCKGCNGWVVTVPAGTSWATGRCGNRRCPKYGAAQRFTFR